EVFCHRVAQAGVEGAHPFGVALGADGAIELDVAEEASKKIPPKSDAVSELSVVAGFVEIPDRFKSRHQPEVNIARQSGFEGENKAAFDAAVADALGGGWK